MAPQKSRRSRLKLLVFAALTVPVMFILAQRIGQRLESPQPTPERPLPVVVTTIEPQMFVTKVESVGTVAAIERILVSAQISATVQEVPNREGVRIEAGGTLVRLDSAQVEQELQRQWAATERARAERDYWRAELAADQSLFEQKLLGRRAMADSRRRMAALDAAVEEAEALLEIARLRQGWSIVTAPWTGVVQRNLVLEGEQVRPGSPLVELVATDSLKVVVPVAESDLARLEPGNMARLRIPAAGRSYDSKIHRIYPALDQPTRNATVEMLLPPDTHNLSPGMVAEVSIHTWSQASALVVPRHAVRLQGGDKGVFVADESIARWRPVRTGAAQAGQIVINKGIVAGERVIITPHPGLSEGRSITLVPSFSSRNSESASE